MNLPITASRRILKIMIVFLLLDAIGAGLLWFGYTSMQSKKTEEGVIRTELAAENLKEMKQKSLQTTLSLAEADRKALERFLFDPSGENQIRFISQIEGLGESTTGALVTINTLEAVGGTPKSIQGDLVIAGTWSELYHVLALIESLPTRAIISRYSVSRPTNTGKDENAAGDEWKGTLRFELASLQDTTER